MTEGRGTGERVGEREGGIDWLLIFCNALASAERERERETERQRQTEIETDRQTDRGR